MKRITRLTIVLAFLSGALAMQAQDFSYDQKIGAQAAQQVEQMMGIYPDSSLNDYVTRVGQRLAAGLGTIPFTFRFHVVDMHEPNAFALPGGYVYVSRGILSLMTREDELAGVLGHEMVHVTKRHSIKQMRTSIIPGLLKIPGALIGGLVNEDLGRIINVPVNFGSALFLSSYSRKQERESDELGIKLAAAAGYDPIVLGGVLESLAEEMKTLTGEEEKKSYFSTHPYTPKRVEDIDEQAPAIAWEPRPPEENPMGMLNLLDGMVIGENPAQGIFRDSLFLHPDMDVAIVFPAGWQTVNVPVAVAAMEPKGNAQVFVGADPQGKDPDTLGLKFAAAIEKEYGLQPTQNKSIDVSGFPGHVVSFKDLSGKEPVDIQFYWIKTRDIMLNIMGMCYLAHVSDVSATAMSVRPLTAEEKSSITAMRIRSAEVLDGETLQALCERTGNSWDAETTARMNGISGETVLKPGDALKIAKEEPYP